MGFNSGFKGLITTLNTEIWPEVTLGDFNTFVCVDCRSEIRFALSPNLSEEQAHSE